MNSTLLRLKALENIEKALYEWGYDDTGGFICYCDGILDMLEIAEEAEDE